MTLKLRAAAISAITVLAACGGGGGGASSDSSVSQSGAAAGVPSVAARTAFAPLTGFSLFNNDALTNPRYTVADFNGDGLQDIVFREDPASAFATSNQGTSPIRVFVQRPDGTFIDATSTMLESPLELVNIGQISSGDFNSDGKPDVVIAESGTDPYVDGKPATTGFSGGRVHFLMSQPTGKYRPTVVNADLTFLHSLAVGDINSDNKPDVFAQSLDAGKSYLLINDGAGNFTVDKSRLSDYINNPYQHQEMLSTYPDGSPKEVRALAWTSTAILDANGDGKNDLMLLGSGSTDKALVFLNDGQGNLNKVTPIQVDASPYGPGRFFFTPTGQIYTTGSIHIHNVVVDINGDGKLDVVTVSTRTDTNPSSQYIFYQGAMVTVLISNGDGTFRNESDRVAFSHDPGKNFTHYNNINISDFNNDGKVDLVLSRLSPDQGPDSATATRFLKNDGSGRFTEVSGATMGLPDMSYAPITIAGKSSVIGFKNLSTGQQNANGYWTNNLTVQSFLAP